MFLEKVLVDFLQGFLLDENPTSVGLQMVVVIITSETVESILSS